MQYRIKLETAEKRIYPLTLGFPDKNISLVQLVKPLQILFDAIIALQTEGIPLSCRKGCCDCCAQMIPLAIPEAFFLAALLSELDAGHKKRVKKRFTKNKNELQKTGLLDKLKNPRTARGVDEQYFRRQMACPFLEEGACSIYQDRPLICREYHVRSTPELCSTPYRTPPDKIAIRLNMGPLLAAFTARLTGLAKTPIPHILAPDWAEHYRHLLSNRYPVSWMMDQIVQALRYDCKAGERITQIFGDGDLSEKC